MEKYPKVMTLRQEIKMRWFMRMHKIYKWLHTYHVNQIQKGATRRQWYAAKVEKLYTEIREWQKSST